MNEYWSEIEAIKFTLSILVFFHFVDASRWLLERSRFS